MFCCFFFNDKATTGIYTYCHTLSLRDALPIYYLQRIEVLVGLHFEFDLESNWTEAMARLRNRELDMFSAAAETPERQDYALFTQPYLTLPAVVFARDNASFVDGFAGLAGRSEEHTSELQSLMRISYAVFCLKKKNNMS